jgi:hypothetical protein
VTSSRERELERQRDRLAQALRELVDYAGLLEIMADAFVEEGRRPTIKHALTVLEECQ